MKKTTILFMVFMFSTMIFISGCGNDDDDGGGGSTGPSTDPSDYTYLLNSYSLNNRDYEITLMPVDPNNPIGEIDCTINGNLCSFSWNDMYALWSTTFPMNPGETYNFALTIDGTEYDADLTNVNLIANVSWPIAYDPSESYTVTWELAADNEFQWFQGLTGAAVEELEDLDPGDRSFTIPEEWLGTTGPMHQFVVIQTNHAYSDDLLLLSIDFVSEIYFED